MGVAAIGDGSTMHHLNASCNAERKIQRRASLYLPLKADSYEYSRHVDESICGAGSPRQAVFDAYVNDLLNTVSFLSKFGFQVLHLEKNAATLKWGNSLLLVRDAAEELAGGTKEAWNSDVSCVGNVRALVDNVDEYYCLAQDTPGVTIVKPLKDRDYGLRDFTVLGPNNMTLRVGARIPLSPKAQAVL